MSRHFAVLLLAGALACTSAVEPLLDCSGHGDAQSLCGFQNPEDLALLPSGRRLLVSEYGGMEEAHPGFLSRLDLDTGKRTELFRAGGAAGASAVWGDDACPGPPEVFSPHGLDLVERSDGKLALLVVNHAGRESVELFEVLDSHGEARVAWRGCAVAPAGSWLNDVEGRSDGTFLVSNMMPRRGAVGQAWEFARALLGQETGTVIAWSPDNGYAQACGNLPEGNCPGSFEIVAVDPKSFEKEVIYRSDGVTMGAGTVGLQVGDQLYVGTFAGDRILRVRLTGEGD